jgi:hypothetical protein
MNSVWRCMALACIALLAPLAARAQDALEDEDGLRVSLGAGLNFVSGAETQVNDRWLGDPPTSYAPLPTPVGVLRIDGPVHRFWLLGVQASVFAWDTTIEEQLGYGNHSTIDLSAVARFRFAFDQYRRSEVVASLAIGPSFDQVEGSPRNRGENIDSDVGLNLGVSVGYQLKPRSFPLGVFAEAGLMHHLLPQDSTFASGGHDEILYQPLSIFLRIGMMFILFR